MRRSFSEKIIRGQVSAAHRGLGEDKMRLPCVFTNTRCITLSELSMTFASLSSEDLSGRSAFQIASRNQIRNRQNRNHRSSVQAGRQEDQQTACRDQRADAADRHLVAQRFSNIHRCSAKQLAKALTQNLNYDLAAVEMIVCEITRRYFNRTLFEENNFQASPPAAQLQGPPADSFTLNNRHKLGGEEPPRPASPSASDTPRSDALQQPFGSRLLHLAATVEPSGVGREDRHQSIAAAEDDEMFDGMLMSCIKAAQLLCLVNRRPVTAAVPCSSSPARAEKLETLLPLETVPATDSAGECALHTAVEGDDAAASHETAEHRASTTNCNGAGVPSPVELQPQHVEVDAEADDWKNDIRFKFHSMLADWLSKRASQLTVAQSVRFLHAIGLQNEFEAIAATETLVDNISSGIHEMRSVAQLTFLLESMTRLQGSLGAIHKSLCPPSRSGIRLSGSKPQLVAVADLTRKPPIKSMAADTSPEEGGEAPHAFAYDDLHPVLNGRFYHVITNQIRALLTTGGCGAQQPALEGGHDLAITSSPGPTAKAGAAALHVEPVSGKSDHHADRRWDDSSATFVVGAASSQHLSRSTMRLPRQSIFFLCRALGRLPYMNLDCARAVLPHLRHVLDEKNVDFSTLLAVILLIGRTDVELTDLVLVRRMLELLDAALHAKHSAGLSADTIGRGNMTCTTRVTSLLESSSGAGHVTDDMFLDDAATTAQRSSSGDEGEALLDDGDVDLSGDPDELYPAATSLSSGSDWSQDRANPQDGLPPPSPAAATTDSHRFGPSRQQAMMRGAGPLIDFSMIHVVVAYVHRIAKRAIRQTAVQGELPETRQELQKLALQVLGRILDDAVRSGVLNNVAVRQAHPSNGAVQEALRVMRILLACAELPVAVVSRHCLTGDLLIALGLLLRHVPGSTRRDLLRRYQRSVVPALRQWRLIASPQARQEEGGERTLSSWVTSQDRGSAVVAAAIAGGKTDSAASLLAVVVASLSLAH